MDTNLLAGLRNGQNTDLSKGTIRNADAVLLLLNSAGGMAKSRDLRAALRTWRPDLSFGYLFQMPSHGSGYGFAGTAFTSSGTRVFHQPADLDGDGHTSWRRQYYYRVRRGVYAITAEGYNRLQELSDAQV